MHNMNIWSFTGNLGKDCEVKQGQNGNRLVFSVGVQSGYGDNAKTTWANCVVFGKRADGTLSQHLTKGQKVAVSGEITLEKWTDASGIEKQALKVIVNSLDLIGGQQPQQQGGYQQPAQQAQRPQQQQRPQQSAPQPAQQVGGFDDFKDDDYPF